MYGRKKKKPLSSVKKVGYNLPSSLPAPSISGLLTRKSKKTDPVVHENKIKQK